MNKNNLNTNEEIDGCSIIYNLFFLDLLVSKALNYFHSTVSVLMKNKKVI